MHPAELAGQLDRVTFLLAHLADQARLSEDLSFAVRAQSQAATLLWPYDRERARAIFRRAFGSIAPASAFKPDEAVEGNSTRTLSGFEPKAAEKRQLRTELINHIAERDPELAEDLARSLVYLTDDFKDSAAPISGPSSYDGALFLQIAGSTMADIERREVLIGVALRVVEREPHRAVSLGQLSLPLGISPNFARLLILMHAADHLLADLLFSSAVAHLEQLKIVDLAELRALGSYLISTTAQSAGHPVNKSLIVRFLKLTFNQMMHRSRLSMSQGDSSAFDPASLLDQSAAAYFIGRQLSDLFARYLPDRLPDLQRKVAELSEDGALDRVIDPAQIEGRSSGPNDIVYEARTSSDQEERNALFARAALAWLTKGEMGEAQAAAAQIADGPMRDRVLARIARRLSAERRIDDAVAIARRIEDYIARVEMFVMLADAARSSGDCMRATELLNEAEREARRARPSLARSQSLLTIVGSFSAFDPLRAFEVMQTAVKSINDLFTLRKSLVKPVAEADIPSLAISPGEIHNLDFESTLAALAQVDFDRALLLAQQLDLKDASLIAQLAVCQGGLTAKSVGEHSSDDDGASRL